jgi:hypothetical protein
MEIEKTTQIHKWQQKHLSSDKKLQVLNWHRKARKTFTGLLKVYREALLHPNTYWIIEPTYKLAKTTVWNDPTMLFTVFDEEVIAKRNETDLSLKLINNSWIYLYGADKPDYLRGPNPKGVIIDEYAVQKRELWEQIVAPIIFSNQGWTWFLFTPKGKNHAYQILQQAKENPDIWEFTELSVDKSGLLTKKQIEEIKKTLPMSAYQQEFECKFLEGEGVLFRKIEEAVSGELQPPKKGETYILGIDLGRKKDYTAIIGFNRYTNHLDVFDRFNIIDWSLQKQRIKEIAKQYNDALCIVEANSMGDPIIEDLRREGVNVYPFTTTAHSKKDIIEKLSIFIENKYITYPNIPELIDELSGFGYEISKLGNVRYGAPEGQHDDCVMAMALAVSQLRKEPLIKQETPKYQFDWIKPEKQIKLDPYE